MVAAFGLEAEALNAKQQSGTGHIRGRTSALVDCQPETWGIPSAVPSRCCVDMLTIWLHAVMNPCGVRSGFLRVPSPTGSIEQQIPGAALH